MGFTFTKLFTKHGGKIVERWVYDAKSPLIAAGSIAQFRTQNNASATSVHASDEEQHRILFGTKDGKLICVDEQGKEQWSFFEFQDLNGTESFFVDTERVHAISAPPTIGDIDNDGKQEILFGNEYGTLYCLDANGKLRWKFVADGSIKASPMIADINSDGYCEILIGSTSGKLYALDHNGKKIFDYDTLAPIECTPSVYHRKKTMIVFGNNNGTLHAITPAQELLWRVELSHKITASPVMFSDPQEERMIIGTHGGDIHCISEHGEIVWTYATKGSIYGRAAIADLNKDKLPEIVIGSCDNHVYALNANGKKLWSFETDFWVVATPLIADIDGDGHDEVIVGSFDHKVYVLDGQGAFMLDYMPGIADIVGQSGQYTNIMTRDPGEQTGKKLYEYTMPGIVIGTSILPRTGKTPALIINITSGKVSDIEHQE